MCEGSNAFVPRTGTPLNNNANANANANAKGNVNANVNGSVMGKRGAVAMPSWDGVGTGVKSLFTGGSGDLASPKSVSRCVIRG